MKAQIYFWVPPSSFGKITFVFSRGLEATNIKSYDKSLFQPKAKESLPLQEGHLKPRSKLLAPPPYPHSQL